MNEGMDMNKNSINCWREFFSGFKKQYATFFPSPASATDISGFPNFFREYRSVYDDFWVSGGAINIWDVAGLKRDEVRNTAVLAWLLDCHGSHGQGNAFLKCFLESLRSIPENKDAPVLGIKGSCLESVYRTMTERVFQKNTTEDTRSSDRVDIVIEGNQFLLFVEAKIDAGEGPDQTGRYSQIVSDHAANRRSVLVFLTRDGRNAQAEAKGIATLSWGRLACYLEKAIKKRVMESDSLPQPLWATVVLQFCRHIRTF
ncbi:MAG: PD-(D/E)XK nuclease family protein [Alistipes senegalensis]|nr:PD-(D/E)XK nuclease family protein [Oxalobacter formigenes]MCM1281922.1 PD-(D/E)XK nuclease family protein [Alistipes senegalensis]